MIILKLACSEIFGLASVLPGTWFQTRRHGGAYRGCAPQMTACAPPSEDCAPKKLTGSGLLECKSRQKLAFFVDWTDIGFHDVFAVKTFFYFLFFWSSSVFGRKNRLNFRFRPANPSQFRWRPFFCFFFFLEITFFFWRSPVFGRKNRLNLRFRPENPLE